MTVRDSGASGESAADRLRRLFLETHPALLRYALRRSSTEADAEDAVADTYAIAWRRLAVVPTGDATLPWLYGACRRVLANQRRGHDRRRRLLERAAMTVRAEGVESQGAPGPAMEVLARMRRDDQEILRLVAWEDLSHREIAIALGISPNAVAIRLHRARQRFSAALQQDQGGSPSLLRRWSSRWTLKERTSSRTSVIAKAVVDDGPDMEITT